MSLMQEFSYDGEGFRPLMFEKTWQVAILNYMAVQDIDNIDKIDVHSETDEVFLLLYGEAVLITAKMQEETKTIEEWEVKKMQVGIIYNVPAHCWHNIAMRETSSVAIIEKKDTHEGDFAFHYFNKEEKQVLHDLVHKSYDGA